MITQSDISADDLKRIDAAIAEYKEPAAKLRELAVREAKQSAIVEKLRQQYEQAGAVDLTQFDDPDTIQNAKLKVSQLRDELSAETRLLQAITTATINTREGGKSAANHVRTVAERALLNAVSEREASTLEAFSCAAYELLALYVARHGAGHAIGACERAFDLATRNPDHVRTINGHYAWLIASLTDDFDG